MVARGKKSATKSGKFSYADSGDWLVNKLKASKGKTEKTTVIVAHQDDIKGGVLDDVLPNGSELTKSKEFLADLKMTSSHWFYFNNLRRVLLVQKSDDKSDAEARKSWRQLGATACMALQDKKVDDAQLLMTARATQDGDHVGVFQNAVTLTNYEHVFKKPKTASKDDKEADPRSLKVTKHIKNLEFVSEDAGAFKDEEVDFQKVSSEATNLARDLANARGSVGTPEWMEKQVHAIAKKGKKNVKEVRVLQAPELVKQGMNLFYNVGKGADSQPRCVIVHYQGNPSSSAIDLALVGKGVTYDTGGLNLKPTGAMEDMYGDKGGAAAVIGALKGTMELGLKKNIIFSCGFAENAIGSSVYKPGDIIQSMNGLHVEIGNTDAEGRLVMCDTMTYVQNNFKPKRMINIATLTGACMIALGVETGGLFSEDDQMVEGLLQAGKDSFEPMWHMPITDEHRTVIKSKFADITNSAGRRYGGASQAAAFLENFVDKGVKWAHLDIAGPAVRSTAKPPACADQTGFGAALLLNYIRDL